MTAPVSQCQPTTTGHDEPGGFAASLFQQASWIENAGLADEYDVDEIRDAAHFIGRQAARIEALEGALRHIINMGGNDSIIRETARAALSSQEAEK